MTEATVRTEAVTATTTVRHRARPMGVARENGPHLGDLRAFVDACDGLPDDLRVSIDRGTVDGAGRYPVTFVAVLSTPVVDDGS